MLPVAVEIVTETTPIIAYQVTGPDGAQIDEHESAIFGRHAFYTKATGQHSFCFMQRRTGGAPMARPPLLVAIHSPVTSHVCCSNTT